MRSANSPAESAIRLAVFVRLGQTRSRAPDLAPVRPAKARYNPIRMISLRMPMQLSPVESHPCKKIGGYGVGCPHIRRSAKMALARSHTPVSRVGAMKFDHCRWLKARLRHRTGAM